MYQCKLGQQQYPACAGTAHTRADCCVFCTPTLPSCTQTPVSNADVPKCVCVCVVCTPIQSLNLIEGVPPMEEFQRFQACGAAAEDHGRGGGGAGLGHTGDLSSLVAALPTGTSAPKSVFVKGDLVVLVKGTWGGGHTRRRTYAHRGLADCQRSRLLHTGRQCRTLKNKSD